MKLEFKLLIVDDEPDNIESAIGIFSDHLESKGFTLDRQIAPDLSEQGLRSLARGEGKDYDLVMVDYNLGRPDMDGAKAASRIRNDLPYTDMVFYASDSEAILLSKLAQQTVAGVFVATRENLDSALIGIADTVIGKALDLNHMRGIAMAEVAEMDVLMEETLVRAFQSVDNKCIDRAMYRTIKCLRQGIKENSESLEHHFDVGGLSDIVSNGRIFSSTNKFRAIRRVAKCLPEQPDEALDVLGTYENDIIHNRNMLAHAKEESTEDGKTILRSIVGGQEAIIIDDDWMVDFRQNLRKHRDVLHTVCQAIYNRFNGT